MMIRALIVIGAVAACLAGCQTTQDGQDDPLAFGRVDCKRAADHPELTPEFEQAQAICMNRGSAAATAGTANMPGGYGVGGAVAAGINQGLTAASIRDATVVSCMAERGYLLKRQSEHRAMCAAAQR